MTYDACRLIGPTCEHRRSTTSTRCTPRTLTRRPRRCWGGLQRADRAPFAIPIRTRTASTVANHTRLRAPGTQRESETACDERPGQRDGATPSHAAQMRNQCHRQRHQPGEPAGQRHRHMSHRMSYRWRLREEVQIPPARQTKRLVRAARRVRSQSENRTSRASVTGIRGSVASYQYQ